LLSAFLLIPFMGIAQFNDVFVAEANLNYKRLEYCGDGLFGFEQAGMIGYMNANQKVVIQPTNEIEVTSTQKLPAFINGFAVTKYKGEMGVIDKRGNLVIPHEYKWALIYEKSKNIVKVGKAVNGKNLYGI